MKIFSTLAGVALLVGFASTVEAREPTFVTCDNCYRAAMEQVAIRSYGTDVYVLDRVREKIKRFSVERISEPGYQSVQIFKIAKDPEIVADFERLLEVRRWIREGAKVEADEGSALDLYGNLRATRGAQNLVASDLNRRLLGAGFGLVTQMVGIPTTGQIDFPDGTTYDWIATFGLDSAQLEIDIMVNLQAGSGMAGTTPIPEHPSQLDGVSIHGASQAQLNAWFQLATRMGVPVTHSNRGGSGGGMVSFRCSSTGGQTTCVLVWRSLQ